MTALRLEVLGGLRITVDGTPLMGVLSQKGQALLCYLACEPGGHARTTLAALLWGDLPDTDASNNFRQALTQLRRVLDPYLIVTRHTVAFNPNSVYWLDCQAFERYIAAKDGAEQIHTAVELYRGDFLHGFALRAGPTFDEWVMLKRERFRAQALQALDTLARHCLVRGDYAASIAYTHRLLALDSWREEAHRQLMWLYVRTGQRSVAVAQYYTCRRVLAQELGIEPMDETTALYERVRAAQGSRLPSLVLPAMPFVGREAERAELSRLLVQPTTRLVTIVGPGGIGKTRLALEVAAEWSQYFLSGARVVYLASLHSADMLAITILTALGCSLRGINDPLLQLRTYLADKDMLLVLDNFEQLIDAGIEVLVDIVRHAPEVKFLVTSRERLQLQDEWIITLAGLDVPPPAMTNIEAYSAVTLFIQSVRRLRPDFIPTEPDKPAVVDICRLVEGMPLGIELAASWARVLSCGEIASEIRQGIEFLTTSLRDVPLRHRSIRAVVDHSWRLLTDQERLILSRLAVFSGGFIRQAAEQVADASLPLLRALVDQSLLRKQADSGQAPRYDMHELVRQYALEKLDEMGGLAETHERHFQFFLQLAEAAEPNLVGAEQKRWLHLLECEHENLRSALRWALHPEGKCGEGAARLGAALYRFWLTHGHLSEGRRWLQQMLTAPASGADRTPIPPAERARVLNAAGVLADYQGDYSQATAYYEESLALRRTLADMRGVAGSLNNLAGVADRQGDYIRATNAYEESLAVFRELGDYWGIATVLGNLGALSTSYAGDFARARALYQESLALFRELEDSASVAALLSNLGEVALYERDYARATMLLEESIALERAVGDQRNITVTLSVLGQVLERQGEDARALACYQESLALSREMKDKPVIAKCLEGVAEVAEMQGQPLRAACLLGAADVLRIAIGTPVIAIDRPAYERCVASTQSQLDNVTFAAAFADGRMMSLDEAIAYALDTSLSSSG